MARLFGTDGVRGIAGRELTADMAFLLGKAIAAKQGQHERIHFAHLPDGASFSNSEKSRFGEKPTVLIGKDTRASGSMLEAAIAAGITSAGANVLLAGVIPTPAIAHLTRETADCGVVISASHNPYEYNGIKIFTKDGKKLSDALEDELETLMPALLNENSGTPGMIKTFGDAESLYINHLLSCEKPDLSNLKIAIDCANGAASSVSDMLFRKLNPKCLHLMHNRPDGFNINAQCGSTHMEGLAEFAAKEEFDIGIALDGDADRCLCVDGAGNIINGDIIMAICAEIERGEGNLPHDTFVSTVMSNIGLHKWAEQNGLSIITASVGDKYVAAEMEKGGYMLGGEQSGHVIFKRHAASGDGLLTALKVLRALQKSGKSLKKLADDVEIYPQVLYNVKTADKDGIKTNQNLLGAIKQAESELGSNGRVLVRPSGTEPLVRVMVEGPCKEIIEVLAKRIANTL